MKEKKPYLCEVCRTENRPVNGELSVILPAVCWNINGNDRPIAVCNSHRESGFVNWLDGCKLYTTWFILNR